MSCGMKSVSHAVGEPLGLEGLSGVRRVFSERPDPGLVQAAEIGDSRAMMRLAHFFERRDPEQAHRWFHDAAEAGESEAMYRLAEFLTGRQADQARHWYRRAAEAGHLQAMYAMVLRAMTRGAR